MISVRARTNDKIIRDMILDRNEYRLPESLSGDSVVIDIGGHIGAFTQAVLDRGVNKVYCVESHFENFCIAEANHISEISSGRVELIYAAVWRSDENNDVLHQSPYAPDILMGVNTGDTNVIWDDSGKPVRKLAFDDLLMQASEQGTKRIRLLKLDCEGAEWPILFTSSHLYLIDEICGEYHEIGGEHAPEDRTEAPFEINGKRQFTLNSLTQFLQQHGFNIETTRHTHRGKPQHIGLFFAKRTVS